MDINQVRDMFRVGKISSVNAQNCTARVEFPDKDDSTGKSLVSQELPIIVIGSRGTKEYHLPEEQTQVLCLFLPNPSGYGMNDGYVIGCMYSEEDKPAESDKRVRSIMVPDGSYIRFDGQGKVEIHASGHLVLTAPIIDLN